MQIVLYQPEIPPNTGNIGRLCAATKTPLHLIKPLGFSLNDKYLKRAGLDYWSYVDLRVWPDWQAFAQSLNNQHRVVSTSTRAKTNYQNFSFRTQDVLVFGPETKGLPEKFSTFAHFNLRIPIWGQVRSLNIANSVAIILYEAYRQLGFLPD